MEVRAGKAKEQSEESVPVRSIPPELYRYGFRIGNIKYSPSIDDLPCPESGDWPRGLGSQKSADQSRKDICCESVYRIWGFRGFASDHDEAGRSDSCSELSCEGRRREGRKVKGQLVPFLPPSASSLSLSLYQYRTQTHHHRIPNRRIPLPNRIHLPPLYDPFFHESIHHARVGLEIEDPKEVGKVSIHRVQLILGRVVVIG